MPLETLNKSKCLVYYLLSNVTYVKFEKKLRDKHFFTRFGDFRMIAKTVPQQFLRYGV